MSDKTVTLYICFNEKGDECHKIGDRIDPN